MRVADAAISTRPWLAGVSSILLPGSGHLYVGKFARFAVIFGTAIGLYCGVAIAGKLSSFPFYVLGLVGLAAGVLVSAFDAHRVSRKGQSIRGQWYQRWWMYVLLLVAFGVVGESFRATRESVFGFGAYRVPGELMQPTILRGEHILVDTRAFRNAAPNAGDVVVYYDRQLNSLFIRRIAAVSGSAIELTWDNSSAPPTLGSKTIAPGDLRGRVTSILWSFAEGRIGKEIK